MVDVRNIKQVHILKDCARTANVQIWDPGAITTYLGNGESVITDAQGNVLTTTTALKSIDRIFIHTRALSGNSVYRSVEIPGKDIVGFHCENYAAPAEQVSVIGYNGTSGNLSATLAIDTLYWIKVINKYNPGVRDTELFSYKSGSITPTYADILLGIASKINTKGGIKKGYDITLKIKATVLTDSAATSIGTTGTVVQGSKTVKLAAGVTTLLPGDAITIATVPYQVSEVLSTTLIKLTMPYQGASATGVAIAEFNDKSTGNWGLKIEGLPYVFEAGKWNYRKCSFELAKSENIISGFVTTPSDRGIGTYEQVADLEWHTKNFQGNDYKVDPAGVRPITYHYDAPLSVDGTAETFDLVTIEWANTDKGVLADHPVQTGSITLAIPVGAGQGDGGTTTIEEVLNKYIVTEYEFGIAIALT